MERPTPADMEAHNRQIMAECFCDLVRYGLRKTHRDMMAHGASASCFTPEAIGESLGSAANAAIFGGREPSVAFLVQRVRCQSLIFCFSWKAPEAGIHYMAGFGLGFENEDLKVRLLWLDLPDRIPISPGHGATGSRRPLEEAVIELLQVSGDGSLAPYPPPDSA